MSSKSSHAVASARRRPNPLVVAFGAGIFLLVGGVSAVVADAQARAEASENSITFTPEQEDAFGGDVDAMMESIRSGALISSLYTGADVSRHIVEVEDDGNGNLSSSIYPETQRVVVPYYMGWHPSPVALPAFAGLALMIGGLFMGATRWHRHTAERSPN
jgi:hypothetical protein